MTVWSLLLPCFSFVFDWPFFINTLHNSIHPQEFISVRYNLNGTLLDMCHSKPSLHTIHKLHIYPHFQIPIHHNHLLIGRIRIHLIVAPYQNPRFKKIITIWNFLFFLYLKLGRAGWAIDSEDYTTFAGLPLRGRYSLERYLSCFY